MGCFLAIDIIEHFKKDEILEILKLIYDSLNKKGILIIKTPNSETIFSGRYHYWDFTHEIIFNKTSLMQILSLTGFNNFVFKEEYPIIHGFKSFIRFFLEIF